MRKLIFLLILFAASHGIMAIGRQEAPEVKPLATEYILVITSPDTSALPSGQEIMASLVLRQLSNIVEKISYRIREEDESLYYQDRAWADSREAVVRNLIARRNERDQFIYQGEANWRYRRNIRNLDAAITRLEEELAEIEALPPVIEEKPLFILSETNKAGNYPLPPSRGAERLFLNSQRADAFLDSSLTEYHGRLFLNISLFTSHTNSYSFDDYILFSP